MLVFIGSIIYYSFSPKIYLKCQPQTTSGDNVFLSAPKFSHSMNHKTADFLIIKDNEDVFSQAFHFRKMGHPIISYSQFIIHVPFLANALRIFPFDTNPPLCHKTGTNTKNSSQTVEVGFTQVRVVHWSTPRK
jgi:hypothetical protein